MNAARSRLELTFRHAGRSGKGASKHLLAHDQFGNLAVLAGDIFPDRRHAHLGHCFAGLETGLNDQVSERCAVPLGLLRPERIGVIAADAVGLPTINREHDFGGRLVAAHELELGARQRIEHVDVVDRRTAGGNAGHGARNRLRILEGLDLRFLRGDAEPGGAVRGAEISKLGRVIAQLSRGNYERLGKRGGKHDGDDGAVFWRNPVQIFGSLHAARARHVLHDDVGLSGQMLADVPGDSATIDVEPAAGIGADHDGDGFALIGALGQSLVAEQHTD